MRSGLSRLLPNPAFAAIGNFAASLRRDPKTSLCRICEGCRHTHSSGRRRPTRCKCAGLYPQTRTPSVSVLPLISHRDEKPCRPDSVRRRTCLAPSSRALCEPSPRRRREGQRKVEWQIAHWIPTLRKRSPEKKPVTPRTAFSLSSASVVAALSRLTRPALTSATRLAGSASASIFRPSAAALRGLSPWTDAAVCRARNGFVQAQFAAPELFASERIEPKGAASFVQHSCGVDGYRLVKPFERALIAVRAILRHCQTRSTGNENKYCRCCESGARSPSKRHSSSARIE
jgi:hypothetical protein